MLYFVSANRYWKLKTKLSPNFDESEHHDGKVAGMGRKGRIKEFKSQESSLGRKSSNTNRKMLSETRIKILTSMLRKRRTVTELSRELNLSKATIHRHLTKLNEKGLVRKVDEGYRWTYYELTENAKKVLELEVAEVGGS